MTLTVSAVIPTYEGRERLLETVPALLGQAELDELVVVVDGSDDGSLELLESWAADDPRLRPLMVDNGGDNRARQIGAEHATGDVLLFIDDDVVAAPGLVRGHLAHHERHDRLVVVGYMPVATPVGPTPEDFPVRLYARSYERQCSDYEEHPERILHNLWNGNISIRRAECLRVGIPNPLYDERYAPDRDLGLRLQAAGLTGVFDRALRAEHRYVRTGDRFFADSSSGGAGRWICHCLYADEVGPLTAQHFEAGMSGRTRWAVRAARRPLLRAAIDPGLRAAIAACGRLGMWHAQEQFAYVLSRVRGQAAAMERSRRPVGPAQT